MTTHNQHGRVQLLRMEVPPELLQALSNMIASALQTSATSAAASTSSTGSTRPPTFSMTEYRSSEGTTVEDYFKRFDWGLQLSKISNELYGNYARVHMGAELNNALKFLVCPRKSEELTYDEIKSTLTNHFDRTKNKYAESIKFRHITQQKKKTIANFILRLKQGSAHCEYDDFLDRMLIEQLLHGLESREMCDEIIAKKPTTFNEACEIAYTLEATRYTADEVKNTGPTEMSEQMHKLGIVPSKMKYNKKAPRSRSQSRSQGSQRVRSTSRQDKQNKSDKCRPCNGCGGLHMRNQCQFRQAKCFNCDKQGHIAKVCRTKKNRQDTASVTEQANTTTQPADSIDSLQQFNKVSEVNTINPLGKQMLNVQIDGHNIPMELDTGAPCSIISKKRLITIKPNYILQSTKRQFTSYTGHPIKCIGLIVVNVTIGSTTRRLELYVVDDDRDTLLGREWIIHFIKDINFAELFSTSNKVHTITSTTSCLSSEQKQLDQLLARYEDVFSNTPGKLKGPPATIHFKSGATPVFARAREIPLALREAYAKEIDAKIASGFYERVEHSEWASTTHVVTKKNGKIRITGNYKPTLNPRIVVDEHPIPRAEHLFNKMKGANLFCHLDITDAYTHLPVDEEFSHALTLNTPTHELIRPKRAVYGAASIPAIWQRRMESVLQDLPNVLNFFDDILVFANGFDNLLTILDASLERIRSYGLQLNRSKCIFATSTVEFLGHKIDSHGVHKSDKHIEAIRDAPKPTTREELTLFLGKATYYRSFIPDLSTKDRPLRDMLLNESFTWTKDVEKAYTDIKNILISPQVLMPYNPSLPLLLATDASKTGLGAVLSHKLNNGEERPIAYASRTLSNPEQRYPQIDKEALAIIWAVQKFFHYLYARHFTLISDHKPLMQILHPEKSLPVLCISRMANYADYLAHFDYDVVFKPTKANANADYCSRAPLPTTTTINKITATEEEEKVHDEFDEFVFCQIRQLPVRAEHIARETRKDLHLGKILQLLETGQSLASAKYKAPEVNYTLAANCLLFEHRVVIPESLRQPILKDLHAAHVGIVKMKGIARSYVYWPGIDADIERIAKSCHDCAKHAHNPPKFREHHWEYPKGSWQRIHIDYAGPVAGMMLLIIADAYSKWIEVKVTNSITTAATIVILDGLFASYGIPITIVSDNGPQFTATEFKTFLQNSGVKYHKLTAPYHPATNGQAKRYVQTTKDALKAMSTTRGSLQRDINEFLRQYRKAPHTTTGHPPALLFLGRNIRTRIDLVRPDSVDTKVTEKQQAKFITSFRTFKPKQIVYFLSGNPRMDKWVVGRIVTRLGDLHYEIDYRNKRVKRHVDQIRASLEDETISEPMDNKPTQIKKKNTKLSSEDSLL